MAGCNRACRVGMLEEKLVHSLYDLGELLNLSKGLGLSSVNEDNHAPFIEHGMKKHLAQH